MQLGESVYDWAVEVGRRVLPHTPLLPEKVKRSVAGRAELLDRIEGWARERRGPGPLVWVHAPSVGEGLQTRPVLEALRDLRPDLQIFYTYFSPSAEKLATQLPVDFADYMPFDVVEDLERAMEAVQPQVLVFGKLDVWPNITRVARWRGVPMALISATLAASSSRLAWPARQLLAPAYGRLDAVGAISEADGVRLEELGVARKRIRVTGDARFDQVWERAQAIDRNRPPLSVLYGHHGPTLVAGSTWGEDERHIVPALAHLRAEGRYPRAVLVPHEPTRVHLERLEAHLEAQRLEHVRLSELEAGGRAPEAVVVVDRVGVLGELYALADIAYVGGGFGRRGLHSVLEPATLGAPVLFGPRHGNAREAGELVHVGGAMAVEDAAALESALARWLNQPERREAAGRAALRYVEGNLGAGRRNAELVVRLLEGEPPDDISVRT